MHTGIRQVLDQRNVDRKGEAKVTHPSTREMLYTYLGKRTGERVLTGAVKRGDGEKIYAVIWFCDLRDSTSLAESMPVEAFLDLLNQFFDCTAGAVLDHGGEILRFIGDASLAIFPIGGSSRSLREVCTPAEGACERALAAARDASSRIDDLNRNRRNRGEQPLGFALAIHIGEVMYGNIGVPGRLEFTVIGSAANEAARLAALCRELDQSVLILGVPAVLPRANEVTGHPSAAWRRHAQGNLSPGGGWLEDYRYTRRARNQCAGHKLNLSILFPELSQLNSRPADRRPAGA